MVKTRSMTAMEREIRNQKSMLEQFHEELAEKVK